MSGICGAVRLDGAQASPAEIEPMLARLGTRGPDGSHVWADGPAALGQASLATTPEAVVERLPLAHPDSGCTITADARIDNREELFGKLGLDRTGRIVGDGELILRAYLKWGDDCPLHLLGDFAFAIWDSPRRRLFCARDHMGMRQLTYAYRAGRAFLFSTEPDALVRHPAVGTQLNYGRIADYLDDLEGYSLTETFYQDVSRLPPAHLLVVEKNGPELRRYWQLARPAELKLRSDQDYEEALLNVLGAAVRSRLRSPGPVGSMLSGGLDSSAVTAVAAELLAADGAGPLSTFSASGPDASTCRETAAIQEAMGIPGIAPHLIDHSRLDPLIEDLVRLTKEQSEPFDCHMGLLRAVYLAAHRQGLKVVLDGGASDAIFSRGNYAAALLRRGKLASAWREARGTGEFWGKRRARWTSLAAGAWVAWAPARLRHARQRSRWDRLDRQIGQTGLISTAFASKSNLRARRREWRSKEWKLPDEGQLTRELVYANLVVGRERYDRVASSVGMEPRDPFIDLRVIEFAHSLPFEQLQHQGWPKVLLRRAMAGKLPDSLRWRRGSDHLGPAYTRAIFRSMREGMPDADIGEVLAPFVRDAWVNSDLQNVDSAEYCHEIPQVICLYTWLKSQACELSR